MTNPTKICVVGSINIDFVIRTQTLPRPGETLGNGSFFTAPGGKGANQALAARRLGADVAMLGCVGDDPYANLALENLRADGVDLSGVTRLHNEATGAAFINLSEDGENQIALAPGANAAFSPERLQPIEANAIIAQLEVPPPTIIAAVEQTEGFFCLNAAPARALPPELMARADLIVVNETELAFYRSALADFNGLLACTYGAQGAALFSNGKELARATPPKVDVRDTTGAGDCFTAALTVALLQEKNHENALSEACACAALAVTQTGAQAGMPMADVVDHFLKTVN